MARAQKRYYSTRDLMTMLEISQTKALQLMHMFEPRGQLLRDGRLLRVEISAVEAWIKSRQGGTT